jgi:hypothetical protein
VDERTGCESPPALPLWPRLSRRISLLRRETALMAIPPTTLTLLAQQAAAWIGFTVRRWWRDATDPDQWSSIAEHPSRAKLRQSQRRYPSSVRSRRSTVSVASQCGHRILPPSSSRMSTPRHCQRQVGAASDRTSEHTCQRTSRENLHHKMYRSLVDRCQPVSTARSPARRSKRKDPHKM